MRYSSLLYTGSPGGLPPTWYVREGHAVEAIATVIVEHTVGGRVVLEVAVGVAQIMWYIGPMKLAIYEATLPGIRLYPVRELFETW